jgi:hypothetical protein
MKILETKLNRLQRVKPKRILGINHKLIENKIIMIKMIMSIMIMSKMIMNKMIMSKMIMSKMVLVEKSRRLIHGWKSYVFL